MTFEELWEPFLSTGSTGGGVGEERFLRTFLPAEARVHHMGSTAVEGICAEPIVDILVEVPESSGFSAS